MRILRRGWTNIKNNGVSIMSFHAKDGNVKIDNTDMDYITFGSGGKNLVLLPGLGDGLRTVKGYAIPFALLYRKYTEDYTVYVFSRKNQLGEGYTTRDMARDTYVAMKQLDIDQADIVGVSQGGMIAQYLAIDFPEVVSKLVLVVTLSRPNETMQEVIANWTAMAKADDYIGLMRDTAEKTYSDAYLSKGKPYMLLARAGKIKDVNRFLIMANACMSHDSHSELSKIKCPTLVVGGMEDKIVTGKASEEVAAEIEGSLLYMYEGLGHGLYEEAKDFNRRVLDFLAAKL